MPNSAHDEHRPNVKLYIAVFAALLALTLVTVIVSKFHLPRPQAIALGLAVASAKAGLVAAIFMHLWGEQRLIFKILLVTAFFGSILILPLLDCALILPQATQRMPVAEQHPHEGPSNGHVP